MQLWASGDTSLTLSVPVCKMGLIKPTSPGCSQEDMRQAESQRNCGCGSWHHQGPRWVTELSRVLCSCHQGVAGAGSVSLALPSRKAFAEARPKGQEARGPLLPAQPWPHCYSFQLKKENISSSSSSSRLCPGQPEGRAGMGQGGEAPTQVAVRGQVTHPGASRQGPAPSGPLCPQLQRHWIRLLFPKFQVFCATWVMTYCIFVFKLTHILKTSINAFTKQALHHYCTWKASITWQKQKVTVNIIKKTKS